MEAIVPKEGERSPTNCWTFYLPNRYFLPSISEEYAENSIQKMMKTYFKRILRIKSRKSLDECPE